MLDFVFNVFKTLQAHIFMRYGCVHLFSTQNLSSVLGCRIPLSPHLCLLIHITSISLPTKQGKPTLKANNIYQLEKETITEH